MAPANCLSDASTVLLHLLAAGERSPCYLPTRAIVNPKGLSRDTTTVLHRRTWWSSKSCRPRSRSSFGDRCLVRFAGRRHPHAPRHGLPPSAKRSLSLPCSDAVACFIEGRRERGISMAGSGFHLVQVPRRQNTPRIEGIRHRSSTRCTDPMGAVRLPCTIREGAGLRSGGRLSFRRIRTCRR